MRGQCGLDARPLKDALNDSAPGVLAVIASEWFYDRRRARMGGRRRRSGRTRVVTSRRVIGEASA